MKYREIILYVKIKENNFPRARVWDIRRYLMSFHIQM